MLYVSFHAGEIWGDLCGRSERNTSVGLFVGPFCRTLLWSSLVQGGVK